MSRQIQIQKNLSQVNFLTTTPYEVNDLTHIISQNDKFVIRQGDLIVTNYLINEYRKKGLRARYLYGKNKIYRFMESHIVIPLQNQTVLLHPEHGITIIPKPIDKLNFYTFEGGD